MGCMYLLWGQASARWANLTRFLLARLCIDSLACKTTTRAIKQTLRELDTISQVDNDDLRSKVVDNAYENAMERIQSQVKDHRDLAMQALSWISCAERHLTSMELQHAIGIEENASELDEENIPGIELIVSASAGLVIVDKESDIIRLVHHTAQEYFHRTSQRWFPDAHLEMTNMCTIYLMFEDFKPGWDNHSDLCETLRLHPFYGYASINWGHHAAKSVLAQRLLVDLFEDTATIAAYNQAKALSQAITFPDPNYRGLSFKFFNETDLHHAAWFGLSETVSLLLKKRNLVESKESHQPLELLVNENNIESQNNVMSKTPLAYAANNGHEAVVKLLLENNAQIETRDLLGQTPLSLAAESGYEAVVKLLLENHAQIESRDEEGKTPFAYAALCGRVGVVKLLLENDAQIESQSFIGQTPLHLAALRGQGAMVKLLLENGAQIESQNILGLTPLALVAFGGHEAMVKLLLENDAQIESRDKNGRTPLAFVAYMAYNGEEAMVRLLLDNNAQIESRDNNGRTPLHSAAERGREAVVRLLLENNAQTESRDIIGRTPLHSAAKHGCEAVVKLLLEYNADAEATNGDGKTPLWVLEEQSIPGNRIEKREIEKWERMGERERMEEWKRWERVVELLLQRVTRGL